MMEADEKMAVEIWDEAIVLVQEAQGRMLDHMVMVLDPERRMVLDRGKELDDGGRELDPEGRMALDHGRELDDGGEAMGSVKRLRSHKVK